MPNPLNDISRWPGGVSDSLEIGPLANYAALRPFRYYEYIDEFMLYTPGSWILTETAAASTEVISTVGAGGWLVFTNVAAGATDEASIQWSGGNAAVVTPFTWDATKDMFMGARFKLSDATNAAALIGLASVDTTPVASLPTNGIFFFKAGGATALIASIRIAGVSTSVSLGAMANDTFVDCVMAYTAANGLWACYLNGVLIGSLTAAANTPTVPLTQTIGLLNASAVAHVLSVDWYQASVQR